jgi:peroxiredoxin
MLAVGDKAPVFAVAGSDGKVDLGALLKKKKPVVLYFFPRAMTPG